MLKISKIASAPIATPTTTTPVDKLLESRGGNPEALGGGGELRPGVVEVFEGGLLVREGGGGDAEEPGLEGLVGFDGGG